MKIEFIQQKSRLNIFNSQPKPAINYVPKWFKEAPMYLEGTIEKKCCPYNDSHVVNTTYKNCTPFFDALKTGYIFELPVDIQFRLLPDRTIEWYTRITTYEDEYGPFISTHNPTQHPNLPCNNSSSCGSLVFKWSSNYSIKTPKGYSTLFTHPFNRTDLPFTTYTGVVDTDTYFSEVQFPFQLTYDFKKVGDILVIEKGTPICQVLPFRRDNWVHTIQEYDKKTLQEFNINYFSKIVNAYKSRYWKNKKYT